MNVFSKALHGRCLIVDMGGLPIDFCHWSKAIVRTLTETAMLIEPYKNSLGETQYIHTVKLAIPKPAIIAHAEYHPRVYGIKVRCSTHNVFARDMMTCQYTGRKLTKQNATLDHVIPRASGGKSTWDNLVTCDKYINNLKAEMSLADFQRKYDHYLQRVPKKPTRSKLLTNLIMLGDNDVWKEYLISNGHAMIEEPTTKLNRGVLND